MPGLYLVTALLIGGIVNAAYPPQELTKTQIAKKVKSATCLVEIDGSFRQGSAFCVHESGLFLTNEHVVGKATIVNLVVNPGQRDQKSVRAQVVRTDKKLDLALLKAAETGSFAPLPLGSSAGLSELDEIIAAGFPFGKALALDKGEYPTVSVSAGRLTALRSKNGVLERLQMDAVVQPGNSGGPVLDLQGKVIGIVVEGIASANINFAIPVSHVYRFAAQPDLEVTLPKVNYVDRFKKAEFQVRVLDIIPTNEPCQLELVLDVGSGKPRSFSMVRDNGVYKSSVIPGVVKPELRITVVYPDGNLQALANDQSLVLGELQLKLSQLRKLVPSPKATAWRGDEKIVGALREFDVLPVILGSDTWKIDPRKAKEILIQPSEALNKLFLAISARRGDAEVARVEQVLAFKDAPAEDPSLLSQKLEGLWVLESSRENGGQWPIPWDEAMLIEGNKLRWVKSNGRPFPNRQQEADIAIDYTKKVASLDIRLTRPSGESAKWLAICKVDGNRLTIATNCNEDSRPAQFTTSLTAGRERATFVRVYKRETISKEP
jgi:uncharacterized protein (TIGR03067 family)